MKQCCAGEWSWGSRDNNSSSLQGEKEQGPQRDWGRVRKGAGQTSGAVSLQLPKSEASRIPGRALTPGGLPPCPQERKERK